MHILAELRSHFASVLAPLVDDVAPYVAMIRPAQDARFGDFQANCAMSLKAVLGGNPREIATDLVAKLDVADLCEPPEVAGPGFVNLRLKSDWLRERLQEAIGDERLGVPVATSPRNVIVDFSAPNVAKPMHVGHLRSTVIGHALVRVLRFLGHHVTGDNHIGDWGTQFGMIIYGFKHLRDEAAFEAEPVTELARLYRLVNQLSDYHATKAKRPELEATANRKRDELSTAESATAPDDKKAKKALKKLRSEVASIESAVKSAVAKIEAVEADESLKSLANEHPDIARLAREETAKLHAGDAENLELWNRFLPECLAMLNGMYGRLDITFDETLGESFYQPMLGDVVADLDAKGIATESDGATCVFTEGFDAPFIVRKSDGAFTYATTDLATIRYRVEERKANDVLYVVDSRQGEHFEQLFATARRWGFEDVNLRHVKFGTILGKDGKPYKTRSGDTVGLESLIDEAVARSRAIVDANDDGKSTGPELDEATRADVADAVGIGGIKYFDLNHNRESDYKFDWDVMLAKEGDTATYMQYAYARVFGIFRRGEIDRNELRTSGATIQLDHAAERALGLRLASFADALADVAEDNRPNFLTSYLFALANEFSTFYDQCSVLKEENADVRASRLLLCDLTARVIECGLGLLGIRTCERM